MFSSSHENKVNLRVNPLVAGLEQSKIRSIIEIGFVALMSSNKINHSFIIVITFISI